MTDDNFDEKNRALEKVHRHQVTSPQPLYYPPETHGEEVHLRGCLNVILRRKWIVITFLVAIITTVTIGTFLKKPFYRSTVTIKIEKENPNILAFKDVIDLGRADEDYYQTQYKVLKSRNLAKRVIRSLNLQADPEFGSPSQVKEKHDDLPMLEKQNKTLDDGISYNLVDSFLGRVEVSPLQKSRLVNVSFSSYDPELSARAANAIGDAFIDLNVESKFEATNQARTWLEKQLEIMKAKVEQAEEKLNEYAAKNEIIFLEKNDVKGGSTDSENIVTKKLAELSTELTSATSERIGKEALYKETKSGDQESSSIVMNNPLIMDLKKTYASLESEYNELLKIYKPDYPRMIRLKEHINQVKKKIDQETKRIIASVRKDYEIAVKRENQFRSALNTQKQEALDLNRRTIQYQIMKREADTNKELYNGLLQRLKETGVSASLTASNIQILDKAEVPKRPFKPNKRLNILLSVIVGLFGGIGIAFFTEYIDDTIKTPEDIEKKVSLPPLGFVPHYTNGKDNLTVEYLAHSDGMSSFAEAFRSIRTFLLLSTGGKPPRIVMVTSPTREEGKTTTAINTAISLTKSDVKVVLVDADMRRPRLHKVFSLDNTLGLSTFLSGNMEFDEGLIRASEIENLDIISSGPVPPNPAELVSSYRFQELIHGLYPLYNFIILDTSPVLGMSDPLIVSRQTDGVIMVLKSGKTLRGAAYEATRSLHNVNAKILGVVLNSVSQSSIKYSYHHNYYK